jgi:hypothetical protein
MTYGFENPDELIFKRSLFVSLQPFAKLQMAGGLIAGCPLMFQ